MCGCLDWVGKKVDWRALVGDDLLIEEIMSIIRRFVWLHGGDCCDERVGSEGMGTGDSRWVDL